MLLANDAREEGKQFARLAPCAEAALLAYPWPGNVRELQNALRRAVVLYDDVELTVDHLPDPVRQTATESPLPAGPMEQADIARGSAPARHSPWLTEWMSATRSLLRARFAHGLQVIYRLGRDATARYAASKSLGYMQIRITWQRTYASFPRHVARAARIFVSEIRAALALGWWRRRRPPAVRRAESRSFVGSSSAMRSVYHTVEIAAASNATIFISGESGTGKEVCAEAIHRGSARTGKPFVAINCAAIPKDLAESELFGHVKGAFTGAVSDRRGAAVQAHRGTLFLDEICEMDINLQTKLLRFLQTGTLRRVGASEAEATDVRIICATNRDPLTEIAAGRFREDLYYRLHVIPIHQPALRDRDRDVLEIARVLLANYAREEGKQFARLAPCAEAALLAYPWPGNVRELQNALHRAVVLYDDVELTVDHLPDPVRQTATESPHVRRDLQDRLFAPIVDGDALTDDASASDEAPIKPLWQVEKETIEAAIQHCSNNIPRAAEALGLSSSTIYRKRQVWGLGADAIRLEAGPSTLTAAMAA